MKLLRKIGTTKAWKIVREILLTIFCVISFVTQVLIVFTVIFVLIMIVG